MTIGILSLVHAARAATLFTLLIACSTSEDGNPAPLPSDFPPHSHTDHPANRLIDESSPYLQLHAHNPVDWYPWGPEAFEKAKAEGKPIFLSVGYSTCFWCHVMERKVFSNVEIAALMNEWFVNIKVDREERPDVDVLYMMATQRITGQGGWPNSVFLTQDRKPFFAGTYFPPEDDSRIGRPGFPTLLRAIHDAWENKRDEVERQADQLTEMIQQGFAETPGHTVHLDRRSVDEAVAVLARRYDPVDGGFGPAPKFPPDMAFALLEATTEAGQPLPDMVDHTLRSMASGGIHDHLEGGFHRYATDRQWRVPHFEKMLYNQALFARAYLHAYKTSGDTLFRTTAEGILRFVARTLTTPSGAFTSALDAQTDGREGVYYIWTKDEIHDVLGSNTEAFLRNYGLAPLTGEEGSVLYRKAGSTDRMQNALQLLASERRKRPSLFLDDKIIAGWNGLMIDAFAEAYAILGDSTYRTSAERAADFVLTSMKKADGGLYRIHRGGHSKGDAYQEDYAFLTRGLLSLFRATGKRRHLEEAERLTAEMNDRFLNQNGGYAFGPPSEHLIVRITTANEGAVPSGNSQAVHNLLDLAELTGKDTYADQARRTLEAFSRQLTEYPGSMNHLTAALARYTDTRRTEYPPQASAPQPALSSPLSPVTVLSPDTIAVDVGTQTQLTFFIECAEGWHINAHVPSMAALTPTTLSLSSNQVLTVSTIHYPKPKSVLFAFADTTLDVYDGRVSITADVTVSRTESTRQDDPVLLARIDYQACDDTRCLAPESIEKTILLRMRKPEEH